MPSPLDRFKKRSKSAPKPWLKAEDANAMPAAQVAEALGLRYELQGKHIELENGFRGTTTPDGVVWCRKDGTGLGDNLAMALAFTGQEFRHVLELLLGYAESTPYQPTLAPVSRPLRLPSMACQEEGRAYLQSRGISPEALTAAEAAGMLRYAKNCVLFVGYDNKQPKCVTRRAYEDSEPVAKRDFKGSDKAFPPVLPGHTRHVWVVEGGTDALALWTLYPKSRWPTVIVSGGSNCRAFIDQPHIRELLTAAQRVTIAKEREKDAETQAKTDRQHAIQADLIRVHCANVEFWQPPAGIKDLAERVLGNVAASPSPMEDTPLPLMEKHV